MEEKISEQKNNKALKFKQYMPTTWMHLIQEYTELQRTGACST